MKASNPEKKRCYICKEEKTIHFFSLKEWNRVGKAIACSLCRSRANKRYKKKNQARSPSSTPRYKDFTINFKGE